MINFQEVFDVYRLFQLRPDSNFKYFNLLVAVFFVLFFAAIVLRIFIIPKLKMFFEKKFYSDIFLDLFLTSLAGVLLLFARKAGTSILSSRIFLFLLFFHLLIKLIYYIYFRLFLFPKFLSVYWAEKKRNQYLPKKGKKKNKK